MATETCAPSGRPVRPANSARISAGKAATCSAPRGSNQAKAGATGFASGVDDHAGLAHPGDREGRDGGVGQHRELPGCDTEQSLDGGDQLVG